MRVGSTAEPSARSRGWGADWDSWLEQAGASHGLGAAVFFSLLMRASSAPDHDFCLPESLLQPTLPRASPPGCLSSLRQSAHGLAQGADRAPRGASWSPTPALPQGQGRGGRQESRQGQLRGQPDRLRVPSPRGTGWGLRAGLVQVRVTGRQGKEIILGALQMCLFPWETRNAPALGLIFHEVLGQKLALRHGADVLSRFRSSTGGSQWPRGPGTGEGATAGDGSVRFQRAAPVRRSFGCLGLWGTGANPLLRPQLCCAVLSQEWHQCEIPGRNLISWQICSGFLGGG